MRIPLTDIHQEGLELQFELDPATLGLGDGAVEFIAPIQMRSRLLLVDRMVHATGQVDARVKLQCVRCLEPLMLPVQATFQVNLEPQVSECSPGELHELHREELDRHFYSGDVIDLSELAREQLLLALPTYPLCRADCLGLCPVCGGDRNRMPCRCEPAPARPLQTPFQERLSKFIKK